MPFLPTSSTLSKIATSSTVSIGQVWSLHRRFSVYISLCGCLFVLLYCAALSKIRKRKNIINIDCDTMHIFTNKLENLKVGWSVYIDDCDNIRTYYNKNGSQEIQFKPLSHRYSANLINEGQMQNINQKNPPQTMKKSNGILPKWQNCNPNTHNA